MTRPVLVRRGLTALAVTAVAAVVAVPAWALFSVLSTNASGSPRPACSAPLSPRRPG